MPSARAGVTRLAAESGESCMRARRTSRLPPRLPTNPPLPALPRLVRLPRGCGRPWPRSPSARALRLAPWDSATVGLPVPTSSRVTLARLSTGKLYVALALLLAPCACPFAPIFALALEFAYVTVGGSSAECVAVGTTAMPPPGVAVAWTPTCSCSCSCTGTAEQGKIRAQIHGSVGAESAVDDTRSTTRTRTGPAEGRGLLRELEARRHYYEPRKGPSHTLHVASNQRQLSLHILNGSSHPERSSRPGRSLDALLSRWRNFR